MYVLIVGQQREILIVHVQLRKEQLYRRPHMELVGNLPYMLHLLAQLLCKVYRGVRTNVNVFQKGPKEVGSVASNLLVQNLLRRQLMVKIYRYALKDAATKGNAGKQEKEGTEGQIGTGTETEIVDPIGAGEVFLDITRFIITMNKIWHKINGLTFFLSFDEKSK